MTTKGLAVVLGPTTLRGREEHLSTKEDLQQVSSILQILIEHPQIVFSSDPCAYVNRMAEDVLKGVRPRAEVRV